jgi:hypothetical protein
MSKRSVVSVRTSKCTHYTIEPANGFTAEQVVAMLNKGEVSLRRGAESIIQSAAPPLDGGTVVAYVLVSRIESGETKWEVTPSCYDKDTA